MIDGRSNCTGRSTDCNSGIFASSTLGTFTETTNLSQDGLQFCGLFVAMHREGHCKWPYGTMGHTGLWADWELDECMAGWTVVSYVDRRNDLWNTALRLHSEGLHCSLLPRVYVRQSSRILVTGTLDRIYGPLSDQICEI